MRDVEERRRSPRVRVQHHTLSVVTSTRVRVLDISLGGVLIASDGSGPIGTAVLRMPLPGGRFSSQIRVRHEGRSGDTSGQMGVAFVEMNAESRHSLEHFLAKTSR